MPGYPLLTSRDLDLLTALSRTPLTVRQLLTLSTTFCSPFTSERRLQDRLHRLASAAIVRRWPYATDTLTLQYYYTLSPQSYRLICGEGAGAAGNGILGSIALARQHHARCLADFLVHTFAAAHRAGIAVTNVHRENALRLSVGSRHLYPDHAFTLVPDSGPPLHYFVEIDNSTEPVSSARSLDSWDEKLSFYDALRDTGARFRLLGIATRSRQRGSNLGAAAARVQRNPPRSLFYGTYLPDYLAEDRPLAASCFRDHHGAPVALLPTPSAPASPLVRAVAAALAKAGDA